LIVLLLFNIIVLLLGVAENRAEKA